MSSFVDRSREQFEDTFFILEYLGHPLSTRPNRMKDIAIQNDIPIVQLSDSSIILDKDYVKNSQEKYKNKQYNIVKRKIAGAVYSAYLKDLQLYKNDGSYPEYGIPSLLPLDVGYKIDELEVNDSATPDIPEAIIKFSNITNDELSYGNDAGFTWHNRGAGYRIWVGSRTPYHGINKASPSAAMRKDTYDIKIIFEGFVNAVEYDYAESGVNVSFRLNSHRSVKLKKPIPRKLWQEASTVYELFGVICTYLDIPKNYGIMGFGFSKENESSMTLLQSRFGAKSSLSDAELEVAQSFYNIYVRDFFDKAYENAQPLAYPTCVMLLNYLSKNLGIILRWHLDSSGNLFFGMPVDPNTIPITKEDAPETLKRFVYRPTYANGIRSTDLLNYDFFDSIKIGELERVQPTSVGTNNINIFNNITDKKSDTANPVDQEILLNTESRAEVCYNKVNTGDVTNTGVDSTKTNISGDSAIPSKDLNALNNNAFSYGNITAEVDGCVIDHRMATMDFFYFSGYSLHTGVYLIINIKYSFRKLSKPTMSLKGIRPLALADIENMIGQGVTTSTVVGGVEQTDTTAYTNKIELNTSASGATVEYTNAPITLKNKGK